jgi:hypothetical protein
LNIFESMSSEISHQVVNCYKVDVPIWVTYLNRTPIFEWYVVACGFKNGCKENMGVKKIGLHVQNMISIIGSIVNKIERPFDEHHIFHLLMNKVFR